MAAKAKKPAAKKATPKKAKAGTSKAVAAERKKVFIEAYLTNGGNATQAAITAGFTVRSAAARGSELVKDREVSQEISKRAEAVAAKCELTTERTLLEIARLAYSDPRRFYNPDGSLKAIHDLDDDTAATIASVEVDEIGVDGVVVGHTKKVKQWDKNAALEKAMKFHGLYEKDNAQQQPVEIVIRF